MQKMNMLHFYDLEGNRKQSVVVGEKLILPSPSRESLDFSNDATFFTGIAGTDNFVYCLFNGTNNLHNASSDIFVFDWSGNFVKRLHLSENLHKIVVNKEDTAIFGLNENEEGGINVIRISNTVSQYF
jgi:hypothetical protein